MIRTMTYMYLPMRRCKKNNVCTANFKEETDKNTRLLLLKGKPCKISRSLIKHRAEEG